MIQGFEQYTHDLTDYEKEAILPIMIRGLRGKIGKDHAVTNNYMVEKMTNLGLKVNDARVRKLINHIRNTGAIPGLIASSAGYYVSQDIAEINDYIESLRGRESAIRAIREGMEAYVRQLTQTS